MKITVPVRIESEANIHEAWQARARRAREQKTAVYYSLKAAKAPHVVPAVVTLTRIAPRTLDDDNLASGLKASRDGVALWFGIDDADPRIRYVPAQRKGEPKQYLLEVEISEAASHDAERRDTSKEPA